MQTLEEPSTRSRKAEICWDLLGFVGKTNPSLPAAPPTPHLIGFSSTKGKKESWDPSLELHWEGKSAEKGEKQQELPMKKLLRNPHYKSDFCLS